MIGLLGIVFRLAITAAVGFALAAHTHVTAAGWCGLAAGAIAFWFVVQVGIAVMVDG